MEQTYVRLKYLKHHEHTALNAFLRTFKFVFVTHMIPDHLLRHRIFHSRIFPQHIFQSILQDHFCFSHPKVPNFFVKFYKSTSVTYTRRCLEPNLRLNMERSLHFKQVLPAFEYFWDRWDKYPVCVTSPL